MIFNLLSEECIHLLTKSRLFPGDMGSMQPSQMDYFFSLRPKALPHQPYSSKLVEFYSPFLLATPFCSSEAHTTHSSSSMVESLISSLWVFLPHSQ